MAKESEMVVSEVLAGHEKKTFCPTYDGLVRVLSGAMEVDQEKLCGEPESGFNHEDIISWMSLVDFRDGMVPNVQANLSSDQGRRTIRVDVPHQTALDGIDKKASNSDLIYTMALTEAKMKVIAATAEEIYPAVASQIADLQKEMRKVREEILRDRKEPVSLNMVLSRLESRRVMAVASLLVIAGMILSACGPGHSSSTETPTSTNRPTVTRPTATPIWMETDGPTIGPSPTGTPVWTATPERPTPAATETEVAVSADYAERYTPVWGESYTAQVGGMDIPIYIGLTENVVHPTADLVIPGQDPLRPITEIHINGQEAVDATADYFLRSCHYRYIHTEGNEQVSYDDYLKLVAEGKGQIQILVVNSEPGVVKRYMADVDPRQGFSMVWTNDKRMTLEWDLNFGVNISVDGFGRPLMAINPIGYATYASHSAYSQFFANQLTTLFGLLSFVDNDCMRTGNIQSVCGYLDDPRDIADLAQDLLALGSKQPNLQLYLIEP